MRYTPALLAAALLIGAPALAAPAADAGPTFYRDVLPLLQENCQTCHRPSGENIGGMIAPMALMTYDEVRPWVKSIAKAVQNRSMPPWFATEATRGQFHHERVMSEEEIETILTWARTGAEAGDSADAPAAKRFVEEGSGGWSLGKPDLVVQMPEYWVADEIADININFHTAISEADLPEDVWIDGIEFRVGSNLVHHMCASADVPGGAPSLGKFSMNSFGCIALGSESQRFPEGYAMKLPKGAIINFSMHYNKEPGEGSGFHDQSELGFHFAEGDVREVRFDPIGSTTFEIPPGQERWKVGAARYFSVDSDLLALWPHAHHRAVAARYEAVYPDGTRELLLDVPEYDQRWQTTYQYKEPKSIPAGTLVEVTMWYENTPERGAERGFDSTRGVINGTATTDEMMLGFINHSPSKKLNPMLEMLGVAPTGASGQ
jgi:mono/diheme cytochrome c family protein